MEVVMVKETENDAAAWKLPSPPCAAWMVQVPVFNNNAVLPDTEHTEEVREENETVKLEEAEAVRLTGPMFFGMLFSAGKVIVCVDFNTEKDDVTGGAAVQFAFPF